MVQVSIQQAGVGAASRQRRRHRRPQEPFNVRSRPYEITPFCIHPVLPNETLDNLLFQVDAYSDPIVNRQIGWHANYQFFYVPLMALSHDVFCPTNMDPSVIARMMLNSGATGDIMTSSGLTTAAISVPLFQFKGAMPWLELCMEHIVNRFYRDEGDYGTYSAQIGASMEYPLAYVNQRSWLHSLKEESAVGDDVELPGVDEVEDLDILSGYSTHQTQWEIMRDSGSEDLSYDDYLRAQGVRLGKDQTRSNQLTGGVPGAGLIQPEAELLRFVRKWTKPISTFDPADGSAATALKWSCAERADKKRYFKEPGFIVGVACTTPKIYLGNQKGAIVGALTQAEHWLPQVLQGFGYTSVREVLDSVTDGPLINQDEDYWFDIGDLFNYGGGGFFNHAVGAAQHVVGLPDGNPLSKRILSEADIKAFFVDSTNDQHIYQDGVVHLDVLTTVPGDQTPGSGA